MSSSECSICFNRYDSAVRVPKNLPCGHVKCVECLRQSELVAQQTNRPFKCPECSVGIGCRPESLTTNYTILQEASGVANQYHCDDCNKVADWTCERNGHRFRGLMAVRAQQTESSRKAVETWSEVLEKVVPKVLQMRDIAEEQLHDTMTAQSKATRLTQRLGAFINGTAGPGADQQGAMRDAGECSLMLPPLEQGLRFLELEKGTCHLEVKDGAKTWAAKLDLGPGSTAKPEVLSAARFLMYLLSKEKHMQKQENAAKTPKPSGKTSSQPAAAGAVAKTVPSRGQEGPPRAPQNDSRPRWTITDDGILDLAQAGDSALAPADKTAILKSKKLVTHLIGGKCNEDPEFYSNLLSKHGQYLEKLELRMVHQQHLSMLGSMRQLKDLKIVNYIGKVSILMPPQAGCLLRSLFVKLPTNVQFDLWEAYATSLSNIVLRIEVSTLGIHNKVRAVAAKTPNLRHLRLSRYNNAEHTADECAKQMAAIRAVLPADVTVTCSICG